MRQLRPFLVGLVFGLAVAVVPSCGFGTTCGPKNCSGCCTEDGRCEAGAVAAACGASGNACVACTNQQFCQAGTCLNFSGSGGGSGGGGGGGGPSNPPSPDGGACGPSNCAGCCDQSGTCRIGSAGDACGRNGDACAVCLPEETCNGEGFCEVAASNIGAACAQNSDCFGANSAPGTCIASQPSWPEGYCTAMCMTFADCGGDAHCYRSGTSGFCLDGCPSPGVTDEQGGCRSGYKCTILPLPDGGMDSQPVCFPKCNNDCTQGYSCHPDGFCCDANQNCY